MIEFAGREPQFRQHLWPIYRAIPAKVRGRWHGTQLARYPIEADLTVVASWGDLKRVQGRAVYVEHGIGTRYGNHPSFSGGDGKDQVVLFLSPNEICASQHREKYPDARHQVVGCPKLDEWAGWKHVGGARPVVALSFANRNNGVPEGKSAHPHYARALRTLIRSMPVEFIGHGHPRDWRTWERFWKLLRVEPVHDFSEVLQRADLYCVDASSTAYEFAFTNRPVVTLNAPWYRRDVHHGIRFWDHVPGLQVDHPDDLADTIRRALEGGGEVARAAAVDAVYPVQDGTATKRAVRAIMEVL